MNRFLTNKVRYFLDELIPPFIRDNKFFMYPFFFYWFKGKNISLMMNFKTEILKISDNELSNIYSNLDSRSRDRKTDLNSRTIRKILSIINPKSKTLIKCFELHRRQNSIETQSFFCTICILRLFFLFLALYPYSI